MQQRLTVFLNSIRPLLKRLGGEQRSFAEGEAILRENERDDALFFIEKGEARIFWGIEKFEVAVVFAGDVLGELAYLQKASHSATAIAHEKCSIMIMPRAAIEKLKKSRPDLHEQLYEYLLEILASRFRFNADMRHQLALQKKEISEISDKLLEMDRLKSRFFTNISHELRTPLTLILGQIESVMDELQDVKSREKLQMALRNARQLLRLINQLLDLSKFDAKRMTLNASPKNIIPLLKNLTYSFESLAHKKQIILRFETEIDEIIVNFDQEKIEKIMYNLLSNAFKFTPKDGKISVRLSVSSEQLSANQPQTDHCLLITVRDSGIGIPKDRLPRIFDRFYQVDNLQTREFEGAGVGLALTKELVELHGGMISVESEEGFGTTFFVQLPVFSFQSSEDRDQFLVTVNAFPESMADTPASNVQQRASSSKQQASSDKHPASNTKPILLIVEDNHDVRAYIRQTLERDYRIVEAVNGEDGFEKARECVPDLIITDVMMPKIDGYELSRKLRSDAVTSHIPIIMLTAKAGEEERIEGLETGVDAYLIKPFSTNELRVRVRKLIELRRALQKNLLQAQTEESESSIRLNTLDQDFLDRLRETVAAHLEDEDFLAPALSRNIGMSERQLHRKLKGLLDCSPGQYIRTQRMRVAKKLFQESGCNVTEAAFQVGYGSLSSFTRAFRETFGQTPSAFLRQKR